MDQDQVALKHLVRLPVAFRELGNRSVVDLIQEYGIVEQFQLGTITESSVASHLICDESLVEVWLAWSEDKRCTNGGYFREDSEGIFLIAPSLDAKPIRFDDPIAACAFFILQELNIWIQ